jgi:hypothetical protein
VSGDSYAFQPTANDPDGDRLTFSIANRPGWTTFDPTTGRLQGRPTAADVGTYDGITVTVSDGRQATTLEPFAIDVVVIGSRIITLSWLPPTEHADGTPIAGLGGTKLYWGTAVGDYTHSVRIDNPGITTYVLEGLVPATYYLVATAFDLQGLESDFSEPVSISLP